ncbi:Sulfate adenylyltransferase [Frankliniella fusca]|uniref:Sulfate adenylyltransferase n=1 Tax=Frankliniella fusca TaxID=407009 RepID=A0AAE1GSV6_9NEOP|nr:Sulfate adenylyltransferase [Frankliniella fusca]
MAELVRRRARLPRMRTGGFLSSAAKETCPLPRDALRNPGPAHYHVEADKLDEKHHEKLCLRSCPPPFSNPLTHPHPFRSQYEKPCAASLLCVLKTNFALQLKGWSENMESFCGSKPPEGGCGSRQAQGFNPLWQPTASVFHGNRRFADCDPIAQFDRFDPRTTIGLPLEDEAEFYCVSRAHEATQHGRSFHLAHPDVAPFLQSSERFPPGPPFRAPVSHIVVEDGALVVPFRRQACGRKVANWVN